MSRLVSSLALASSFCLLAVSMSGCSSEDALPAYEARSLVAFEGCTDLLSYARAQLETQLEESYRNPNASMHPGGMPKGADAAGNNKESSSSPGLPEGAGLDRWNPSGQEQGGDRPDVVKTDGSRMFTLSEGVLRVVDLRGDNAKVTDRIELRALGKFSEQAEMLVHENKLLLIERGHLTTFAPDRRQTDISRIREIDLGVPGQAKVVRELEVEGQYVSARKVGSVVRLVTRKDAQGIALHSPWRFMNDGKPGDVRPTGESGANMPGLSQPTAGSGTKPGNAGQPNQNSGGANMPGNGSAGGGSAGGQPKDSSGANMPAGVVGDPMKPMNAVVSNGGSTMPAAASLSFRRVPVPAVDPARWERAVQAARAHNAQVLDGLTEKDFLPRFRFRDLLVPNTITEGTVYGCEQTVRPGLDSGVEMLSVVTIDLGMGLVPGNATGIMANDSRVYASPTSLYVATRPLPDPSTLSAVGKVVEPSSQTMPLQAPIPTDPRNGLSTFIHKFDISNPLTATYRATGQVDGVLLKQFSMSEHEGVLRVAASRNGQGPLNQTDSFVATLQEQGDKLNELGRVATLGKTEMIRAVRFMGDKAFVVNVRQGVPLYSIELSNPAAPLLLGELKIEGHSAFLQPLQPGYLLGVGRDVGEQGQPKSLQVSIFDVRDLHAPKRLHSYTLAESKSDVKWDPQAFLHWPQTKSLVVPVLGWDGTAPAGQKHVSGALLLGADPAEGITLRSRIRHLGASAAGTPDGADPSNSNRYPSPIDRSVVVGDRLWTMSPLGMKANTLTDGAELDWLRYQK